MSGAVLVLAVLAALAQEKEIFFEAPVGVNDQDRLKAAKALASRCGAAGLRDVTTDTFLRSPDTPRVIRVQSTQGLTVEQVEQVNFLASWPCKTVHLRLERFRSKKEMGEFPAGEKAPKGTTWTKIRSWVLTEKPFPHYKQEEEEGYFLLLDKPVIEVSTRWSLLRHPGGDLHGHEVEKGHFMIFRGPAVKTMYGCIVPNPDKPGKTMLPLNLFIDGVRFPTDGGAMGWRFLQPKAKDPDYAIWTFPDLTKKGPLDYLLEHPLPFALKRAP